MKRQLTEWIYDDPDESGWYAITYCYDAQEGIFPGAAYWDQHGQKWRSRLPIGGRSPAPFASEDDALVWARQHDPEEP